MSIERPDLSQLDPAVIAYIEDLEAQLARLRAPARVQARPPARSSEARSDAAEEEESVLAAEPSEPPTTLNVITISAAGRAKRTPRHLYFRQRRGGMGIFDLDNLDGDGPAFLVQADAGQALVLLTDQGRAFRLPVSELPEAPVHARGAALAGRFSLLAGEHLAVAFPDSGGTYLTLVTQRGQVRRMRYHYFGPSLSPGSLMFDPKEGGAPAAACWSDGEGDLFIVTRKGDAIRFAERQVPVRGCLGIRVDPDDAVVSVMPVRQESGVFLLGNDGKGTLRLMAGFAQNKAPGAGGKVAFKTDRLVGAVAAGMDDDIFVISQLGKIIRFAAEEVPAKEGVVQGVNCISLRGDEAAAVLSCAPGRF
jgi:DNA gyrase subunit A